MLKYKWYRWIKVVIFGYRSFVLKLRDGTVSYALMKEPEGARGYTFLTDAGYAEEWPMLGYDYDS